MQKTLPKKQQNAFHKNHTKQIIDSQTQPKALKIKSYSNSYEKKFKTLEKERPDEMEMAKKKA